MQVDFYHLDAVPVERVLPRIAERVLADGGRLLVVTADRAHATVLDEALWSYRPDSFLPHGLAGGEADAAQPVLIALEPVATNHARHVALADGVWREAALDYDRAFHLFDETQAEAARRAWRALGGVDGLTRNFWRQQDGRWAKIA